MFSYYKNYVEYIQLDTAVHWLFPGTVIWYQLHRITMVTAVILSALGGIVVMVEIKGFTKLQVPPELSIP